MSGSMVSTVQNTGNTPNTRCLSVIAALRSARAFCCIPSLSAPRVCLLVPLSDLKAPLSLFKTHTHKQQSNMDFSLVSGKAGSGLAPGQSFSPDLHCHGDRCSGHSTSQEARIPVMWKSMLQSCFKLFLLLPSLFLISFCSNVPQNSFGWIQNIFTPLS